MAKKRNVVQFSQPQRDARRGFVFEVRGRGHIKIGAALRGGSTTPISPRPKYEVEVNIISKLICGRSVVMRLPL
jgi:hypothetical protein